MLKKHVIVLQRQQSFWTFEVKQPPARQTCHFKPTIGVQSHRKHTKP